MLAYKSVFWEQKIEQKVKSKKKLEIKDYNWVCVRTLALPT